MIWSSGFLRSAAFAGQVELDGLHRLFLWQDSDGTPIGMFHRTQYRVFDPIPVAEFCVGDWDVTVRARLDSEIWPARAGQTVLAERAGDRMRVAVHTGSRRRLPPGDPAADLALCIFGHGVGMDAFRTALSHARLASVETPGLPI